VLAAMRWKIVTAGKAKLAYAREGLALYLGRLRRVVEVRHEVVKEGGGAEVVGARLRAAAEGGGRRVVIVLDERGERWDTRRLVGEIDAWEMAGVGEVLVLVGGADGHVDATRAAADVVLRLSELTLQHELAALVWAEALYRAYTIKGGFPYHRDG